LDVVGPVVLSTIIFTAVLVGFGGRSVGYAVGFSLTVNAANAMFDWLRSRRRRVNLKHGGGRAATSASSLIRPDLPRRASPPTAESVPHVGPDSRLAGRACRTGLASS